MKLIKKVSGFYSKSYFNAIYPKVFDVSIVKDQIETTLNIAFESTQITIPITKEMLDALNNGDNNNEFQETLNGLTSIFNCVEGNKDFGELCEKAIPQKTPRHDRAVCPVCNAKAVLRNDLPSPSYCCWCGQKLDWSD